MVRPVLLDTCALLWVVNKGGISEGAEAALAEADSAGADILISPISAWEIGQLVSRGRLALALEPRDWFQSALNSGLRLAAMPPDVLVASSFLPGQRLRDPADRILAATARAYRYRLMTRDQPILAFGADGHLDALAC